MVPLRSQIQTKQEIKLAIVENRSNSRPCMSSQSRVRILPEFVKKSKQSRIDAIIGHCYNFSQHNNHPVLYRSFEQNLKYGCMVGWNRKQNFILLSLSHFRRRKAKEIQQWIQRVGHRILNPLEDTALLSLSGMTNF